MNINLTQKAVEWFKNELDLPINNKVLQFYVRYGGEFQLKQGLRSTYCYEVYNENGELATTGSTELICIKADTFKPIRLDRYFPEWHETYSKVNQLNKEGKDAEVTFGIDHL